MRVSMMVLTCSMALLVLLSGCKKDDHTDHQTMTSGLAPAAAR